jgi:hypothetical protein
LYHSIRGQDTKFQRNVRLICLKKTGYTQRNNGANRNRKRFFRVRP